MSRTTSSWSKVLASPSFAAFCLAFGAAAAAAATYAWSHPYAFTTHSASVEDAPRQNEAKRPSELARPEAPLGNQILLAPIVISSTRRSPASAPANAAVACRPGWRELMQGPSGRRVLETCGSTKNAGL